MKIALLLSSNIKLNPYIEIFRKVLDKQKIKYDIISWDRESLDENEGYIFKYSAPNTRSRFGKLYDYYKFSKFAKKIITHNKYDKLVVFGAAIGVFMYEYLNKYYKNNFWFDYRDLTIEQQFMGRFKKLCDISQYISISSPGFASAFPENYDFILSHNFDIDEVKDALSNKRQCSDFGNELVISTIGGIRDFDANLEVIKSVQNNKDYVVRFIGKGPSAEPLAEYVKSNSIENVSFQGFYLKKDEWLFYEETNFVNIYYPRIKSHETALSNRFYKSLIYKKPMIVTNRSTQGNYVEKYQLGLSLENCDYLPQDIQQFITAFDKEEFANRCDILLSEFIDDYNNFYNNFLRFISND